MKKKFKYLSKMKKFLDSVRKTFIMKTARVHPTPIVILGHAKSGTTVIAKLLSKISDERVTIDPVYRIDPKGKLNNSLFERELSLSTLVQSHKYYFSTPLWKDPKLTFFYDDLCHHFPLATFIFVIRDPRDTIRSFLNRRGIPGDLSELPLPIEEKVGGIARFPKVKGSNYIERLAHRWNCATDVYMNHKSDFFQVRYEDFLEDKSNTIINLAENVGLKPIYDISEHLNQEYQPKGNRNISWSDFFKPSNLHKIESICNERMINFGYKKSV